MIDPRNCAQQLHCWHHIPGSTKEYEMGYVCCQCARTATQHFDFADEHGPHLPQHLRELLSGNS